MQVGNLQETKEPDGGKSAGLSLVHDARGKAFASLLLLCDGRFSFESQKCGISWRNWPPVPEVV